MMRRRLFILGTILLVLGLTLMLSTAYGCIYTITTKHFKICLKYCKYSFGECLRDMKKVAVILERVYKFYTERLHLRMLSPCDQERYLVYYYVGLSQGAVIEINDRCVAYISVTNRYRWFLPLELAHELAHAVNHYYHPDIPGWIDESLANALAYYFLNTTWEDIANAFINDMCTYVQGGTWIPGVPYKWWPFFYYLILRYSAVKVEKESTNITWLKQRWPYFIGHMILFRKTIKCLKPIVTYYRLTLINKNKTTKTITIGPYWTPTILEVTARDMRAIKISVSCKRQVMVFPNVTLNTGLLVTPNESAFILLTTLNKHYLRCRLTIKLVSIDNNTEVEVNGKILTLEDACEEKLLSEQICKLLLLISKSKKTTQKKNESNTGGCKCISNILPNYFVLRKIVVVLKTIRFLI